jgi:hypothetical protein
MAAHYSPNPKSKEMGVPFDLETGEMLQNVWNRWLSWDPTRMVEKYSNNLKKLKLIYIDCGTKDEFNLQWGARIAFWLTDIIYTVSGHSLISNSPNLVMTIRNIIGSVIAAVVVATSHNIFHKMRVREF